MTASMAAFTFNDALVKGVLNTLPLFQIIAVRGIIAALMIFILALGLQKLDFNFPRRDWILVSLRCLSEIGATVFF